MAPPPWLSARHRRDSWFSPKIKKLHDGEHGESAAAMEESSPVVMWGLVEFVSAAA